MSRKLTLPIQQDQSVPALEVQGFLAILQAADHLERGLNETLRMSSLSGHQYNVLRILRSAGEGGLPCQEIGHRMITRAPDITRLLDRLEVRRLVARHRPSTDRRVVTTCITPAGLKSLAKLDAPVRALHARQLSHLGDSRLRSLVANLDMLQQRSGT